MDKEQELLERANHMLAKMYNRTGYNVLVNPFKPVSKVSVILEGHLTFVMLDGKYTGWAKFNPNDKKYRKEMDRKGNVNCFVESKYNENAGTNRALHRALEKYMHSAVAMSPNP